MVEELRIRELQELRIEESEDLWVRDGGIWGLMGINRGKGPIRVIRVPYKSQSV